MITPRKEHERSGARPRGARWRPTRAEAAKLATLEMLMAAGALYGGRELIHDAAGFGVRDEWLRFGIFSGYTIPGVILIVAVGGTMLVAAALAVARRPAAFPAASIAGGTLLVFLAVETVLLGYHGAQQLWLLIVCGATGAALVVLGRHRRPPGDPRTP